MSVRAEQHQTRLPWWRQLRWGLALYFVLLVVGPIILIALLAFSQTRQSVEDQVLAQLESVTELKGQQLDSWLETASSSLSLLLAGEPRRNQFVELIESPDPLNSSIQPGLSFILRDAEINSPDVSEYFFYDVTEGRILLSSDPDRVGQVVRAKPYFLASQEGPHVQPPYYEVTNELTMVVTKPVISRDGVLIGVLGARLNLNTLSGIMQSRTGLGRTGETYLVSAESNFLLTESRFADVETTRAYHSAGIDRALSGTDGAGTYDDYRNNEAFGVYRWLPEMQAALLAEINVSEALEDYNQTQNLIALLAVVLAVAAGGLGVWVATRFTNPINRLAQAASALAAGDLTQRAQATQKNEIGLLAHSFNDMAEQLQSFIGTLEARVQARTRDLQLAAQMSEQISTILDPNVLLPQVVELTKEYFNLYHAHIYLLDQDGDNLVLTAGAGEAGRIMRERGHRIPASAELSLVARAAREKSPVIVSDTRTEPGFLANPLLPDTQSEAALPLMAGERVIGVLDVQAATVDRFDMDLISVLATMAGQIAVAIDNASLFSEVERTSRHEQALSSVTAAIQQATSMDEVLQAAARELGKALRVSQTAIELQLETATESAPESSKPSTTGIGTPQTTS